MSKVYIVQETRFDFTKAADFGELVFMSANQIDDLVNITGSELNRRLLSHLRSFVKEYNQEEDYFIIAGSPYVCAAVMWMVGRLGIRKLNLLRWDNKQFLYIPLRLELENHDG